MKARNGEPEKLLLSIKEACETTGLSEKTMRTLACSLNIEVRIGRRVMIHRKKLEQWINLQVNA